jgi:hypothetical protein
MTRTAWASSSRHALGLSPYGLVGVLQTLSAAPDEKGFALMKKDAPLPVERLDQT